MKQYLKCEILLACLLAGCTIIPKTDDPAIAHNNCYSYIYGANGVKLNYDNAFQWCSLAAKNGGSSSQTLLAELYLNGNGTPKDFGKASAWYKRAAEQGHPHAQFMYFMVNNIYRFSESTEQEKADGLLYLRKAVDAKYPKAVKVYEDIYGKKI